MDNNEIIIFQNEGGNVKMDVPLENKTFWQIKSHDK